MKVFKKNIILIAVLLMLLFWIGIQRKNLINTKEKYTKQEKILKESIQEFSQANLKQMHKLGKTESNFSNIQENNKAYVFEVNSMFRQISNENTPEIQSNDITIIQGLQDLLMHLKLYQENCQKAEQDIPSIQNQITEINQKIKNLSTELTQAKNNNKLLQDTLASLKNDFEQKEKDLQKKIQELEDVQQKETVVDSQKVKPQ